MSGGRILLFGRLLLVCGLLFVFDQSNAQTWPNGPVTIVVSSGAGSRQDIVTRTLADLLSRTFKQSFIIDNRPGAAGMVAARAVAQAKPDGQMLLSSGNSPIAANPHLYKSLPYDPEKDFTPIAMITDSNPLVIAVNPSIPVNTIPQLVEYARARPGVLTSAGFGFLPQIMGEILNKTAGIDIVQVKYRTLSPSLTDTLQGRVAMTITTLDGAEPFVQSGQLKLIATVGRERFPTIPDVPALEEIYPGIAMEGWFVLLGPAGMPDDIVHRINRTSDAFLKEPETQKRWISLGSTTHGAKSPADVGNFLRSETARWGKVFSSLGVHPE